ncbi:MAG: M48 family metallopeptidase [Bacteroidetes bacterium]|nr:M48 family metallopeptidase [Bacteroidota bacterium]
MKSIFKWSLLLCGATIFFACIERVPITNRRQVSLVPESELIAMSLTQYSSFLKANSVLPTSDERTQQVQRVGAKIQAAVESYFASKAMSARLNGYAWEFNVVDDKTINAWCMPGGKVVVYTGLLPITGDDASLAIVMGHEIGHAVARHGNERMSEALAIQAGAKVLQIALDAKAPATQYLFMQSYGAASQLGMLAYSRQHELEADKLGLVFAAMAGYDPRVAVDFWKRMSEKSGAKPPELLSTHPSDEKRIQEITMYLPEALKYYKVK